MIDSTYSVVMSVVLQSSKSLNAYLLVHFERKNLVMAAMCRSMFLIVNCEPLYGDDQFALLNSVPNDELRCRCTDRACS